MAGSVKIPTAYMVVVEVSGSGICIDVVVSGTEGRMVREDGPRYIGGDGALHVHLLFAALP